MKFIKLYENFDWTEDDFDFEEDNPTTEVIGNQYFTYFLIGKDLYDKFIESVRTCYHNGRQEFTVEDINKLIKNNGLYSIIDNLIDWSCANRHYGISWGVVNSEWNNLFEDNPLLRKYDESFDWTEDDFDEEEEQPDIDPYSLKFPVKGIVNSKWNDYCYYNGWNLEHLTGKELTIIEINNGLFKLTDSNKDIHNSPDTYLVRYNGEYGIIENWIPFDAMDII